MPLIGFGYKTGLFAGDPYSFTKKTTANAKASSTPAVSMPAGQKPVKEAANLAGYSSQDVAEYIRIQASVVPFCDAVWSGGQFSHSLDAFLQRVKDKMGQHYMLAMNPHIYRYYFSVSLRVCTMVCLFTICSGEERRRCPFVSSSLERRRRKKIGEKINISQGTLQRVRTKVWSSHALLRICRPSASYWFVWRRNTKRDCWQGFTGTNQHRKGSKQSRIA